MEVYTNKSRVHIDEGRTHFNWEFDSGLCTTAFNIADKYINIEKTVKKMLSKEIVKFIDKKLQSSLNDVFQKINYVPLDYQNYSYIQLCYSETKVGPDNLVLGA